MDLSKRLIGKCETATPRRYDTEIDVTEFIRRVVLFDTFILQSTGLKEIPHLVDVFGLNGLISLLKSGAVRIHCDSVTIGQIGQTEDIAPELRGGLLPLGYYCFASVRRADWRELIYDRLQVVDDIKTLSPAQRTQLWDVIESALVVPTDDFGDLSLAQLHTDLRSNVSTIKIAVAKALQNIGIDATASDFELRVIEIGEGDFRTVSNITDRFPLDQLLAHQAIERGLLSIGGLNQRIEEMRVFAAISGFLPGDLPLFGEKLDFLANALSPQLHHQRFQRVLDIAGMPELDRVDDDITIDVNRLLEIRNSPECREFRAWLSSADSSSDEEIKEHVRNLRNKLSALAHSCVGKDVRFLVTTGIGLLPVVGNVVGTIVGVLDHFLLERILPYSGPTTFINRMYPSVFERGEDKTGSAKSRGRSA